MSQPRSADPLIADPYTVMAAFFDRWSAHMRDDVPFYVALAQEAAPGPVVELGAGQGRVALEIGRAGVDVIAVEPSEAMRTEGARRAAAARLTHVRFVDGDMRTFVAAPPVPLVIIPFRSFQHLLTTEDQLAALAAIYRSLQPGGRLVFNIFTADPAVVAARDGRRSHQFSFDDESGRRHETYLTPRYTIATQRLDVDLEHEIWEAERLAVSERSVLRLRMIGRYEMQHLLERAGFTVEHLYGGFSGEPYGPGPDEMIWIARRP